MASLVHKLMSQSSLSMGHHGLFYNMYKVSKIECRLEVIFSYTWEADVGQNFFLNQYMECIETPYTSL